MSVLTSLEVVPSRVMAAVRYLDGREGVSDDEFRAALSPPSLGQSREAFGRFLNELKRLPLFEFEGGYWRLDSDTSGSTDVLRRLEWALLSPMELAKGSGNENLAPAVAWFLMQDPARPLSIGNWSGLVERDCPGEDSYDLSNEERCRQFGYWAVFFGFGWRLETGRGQTLVPDPTVALRRHLQEALDAGERVSPVDALMRIAMTSPVFEGGRVRESLQDLSNPQTPRPITTLSRSTSLALERLAEEGAIRLESDADAPAVTLDLWPDRRPITHVVISDRTNRCSSE